MFAAFLFYANDGETFDECKDGKYEGVVVLRRNDSWEATSSTQALQHTQILIPI